MKQEIKTVGLAADLVIRAKLRATKLRMTIKAYIEKVVSEALKKEKD